MIAIVLIAGIVSCTGGGQTYALTMAVAPGGSGTATDLTNASPYAAGTGVSIKAVAAAGYKFVSWTAPAGGFANPNAAQTTFTMPAQAVTVTANFMVAYTLTMAVNPLGNGTATDQTGGSPYTAGTVVSIKAVAAAGYQFLSWTAPAGTFANPYAATTTFTMPAQTVTVTANFGPPNHFMGYFVTSETYIGETVYLEDQFGAVNATLGYAQGFCNPAAKLHGDNLTPIYDPDQHFTVYDIANYAEVAKYWQVEVNNQFGTQNLTVYGPVALGVPTQKVMPGPHQPPVGLDHYSLYIVMEGTPVDVFVDLTDEFGFQPQVLVDGPIFFANPVRKTHGNNVTEIQNPNLHAVIYSISGTPYGTEVQVVNQFGPQAFTLEGPSMLAVPSEKIAFTEQFTDEFTTPTLTPEWVISPGRGNYTLTDNPGYLRYIIDAYHTARIEGSGQGYAQSLWLLRPFSGDQWVLTTAITYNMRPSSPTNNRNLHFYIRTPGEGSNFTTIAYIGRSVGVNDDNPGSNAMSLSAGSNATTIYFPNSPNPLPPERWYFQIERNKDCIVLRASNDGNDSTFEYEVEYTFPSGVLGNDQVIEIDGDGWYGSNNPPGYTDFDFIVVS